MTQNNQSCFSTQLKEVSDFSQFFNDSFDMLQEDNVSSQTLINQCQNQRFFSPNFFSNLGNLTTLDPFAQEPRHQSLNQSDWLLEPLNQALNQTQNHKDFFEEQIIPLNQGNNRIQDPFEDLLNDQQLNMAFFVPGNSSKLQTLDQKMIEIVSTPNEAQDISNQNQDYRSDMQSEPLQKPNQEMKKNSLFSGDLRVQNQQLKFPQIIIEPEKNCPTQKKLLLHLKMQRRKKGKRNALQKKITGGYWTKNLLAFAKIYHHRQLKKYPWALDYIQSNKKLSNVFSKPGITLPDYQILYNDPNLEEVWREFFRSQVMFRELMNAKVRPNQRLVYAKFLVNFELGFRTKKFKALTKTVKGPTGEN